MSKRPDDERSSGIHPTGDNPKDKPSNNAPSKIEYAKLAGLPQEEIIALIETEARKIINLGIDLSVPSLNRSGNNSLYRAVKTYYSGGIAALKEKLGLAVTKLPNGYWDVQANIILTAKAFLAEYGELSQKKMLDSKNSSLLAAIEKKYPGGIHQLRQDLGLEAVRKADNYWNLQVVEREALLFLEKYKDINTELLISNGRDLRMAIARYYPGGLTQLRKKLGLSETKKPKDYWTNIENIETAAREFYAVHGALTLVLLIQHGQSGIMGGINKNYPGKLIGLKKKLGIKTTRHEETYWTKEKIEEVYLFTLRTVGPNPSLADLRLYGPMGLTTAILKRYPGGLATLKENFSHLDFSLGEKLLDAYEYFLQQHGATSFQDFLEKTSQSIAKQKSSRQKLRTIDDLKRLLLQSPTSFRELFFTYNALSWYERISKTANFMIAHGVTEELDFILEKFPEKITQFIEQNTDAQSLFQEFNSSSRWLSWAIASHFNLTFDHVYKALQQSPIRSYIGNFTHRNRLTEKTIQRTDETQKNINDISGLKKIRESFYIEKDFQAFTQHPEIYLSTLQLQISQAQNQEMYDVLIATYTFYAELFQLRLPTLKNQIPNSDGTARKDSDGNDIPFPSAHQRYAIIKSAHDSQGIFDGTGSGKTGIGIGTAEYIRAKHILIVCPASVKDVWEKRINEYYIEPPSIFRPEKFKGDQDSFSTQIGRYTIVNYDLLVGGNSGKKTGQRLTGMLKNISFDLVVIDEAHFINNNSLRSEAVIDIAKRAKKTIVLTATPIRNSVEDISRIAYLLNPNQFDSPEALRKLGSSGFSPLAELLARQTVRRKTEDFVELPPFCPETDGKIFYKKLQMSPTQQAVYETVFEDQTLTAFAKLRLLRLVAINHDIARKEKYKIPFTEELAQSQLQKAFIQWLSDHGPVEEIPFDSEYLINSGYKHLYVGAHLHYRGGINEFIKTASHEIQEVWQRKTDVSKFTYIAERIREAVASGQKVVVFSGQYTKGIIREARDESEEILLEDLYTYLNRQLPYIKIGRIDGTVAVSKRGKKASKRDTERRLWQENPEYKVLMTTVPSSSLGIDFTVQDGVSTGVLMIGIDLPYTYADLEQMIARVYRFGQKTPVHVEILESKGTIDEGIKNLIERKQQVTENMLEGIEPERLEELLFNRHHQTSALREFVSSPKRSLERFFLIMRGRGFANNETFLNQVMPDGTTRAEYLAQLYEKYWEFSYSGHTIRLIRQVLDGIQEHSEPFSVIADVGSGPLVLARTLLHESKFSRNQVFINVDINAHALQVGEHEIEKLNIHDNQSISLAQPMSKTDIHSSSCDAVVCSLAFHYSNSEQDRSEIVREANRILQINGYYCITIPHSYLSAENYKEFCVWIEQFGFIVQQSISGQTISTDYNESPYQGWLIVAQKIADATENSIEQSSFNFTFELDKISSYQPDPSQSPPKAAASNTESLIKHDQFAILNPDTGKVKVDLTQAEIPEIEVSDETLQIIGWTKETKVVNGKVTTVYRNRP